jgi:hypothetical protein
LDVLNPLALDLDSRVHYNELQCAVLQFDLAEGIATSTRGLAVQTKTLNAIGGGALNLRTEASSFASRPPGDAGSGSVSSASPTDSSMSRARSENLEPASTLRHF